MGALAGLDDLVNRASGGSTGAPQTIWWEKTDRIGGVLITPEQQQALSLWMNDGQPSGGAIPPTTAAAPDNTTDGAIKQASPAGGLDKWITAFGLWMANAQCTVILYDRLLHISGLSGIVTTAQTVGGAISRYTGADSYANQAFVEINADLGVTATTLTMNYTNQAGTAGQVSPTIAVGGTGARLQSRMIQIPLASGDLGVSAIASVTLATTTGTAGDFGIVIARPLGMVTSTMRGGGGLQTFLERISKAQNGCLAMMVIPHEVQTVRVGGWLSMVES